MEQWSTRRIVVLTLTVGTVLYLVYYVPGAVAHFVARIWDVLVILVMAIALAVVVAPPVEWLCRLRIPVADRTKRMVATLGVLLLLVWGCWALLSLTAVQMFEELQRLASIGRAWLDTVPATVQAWLAEHAEQLPPGLVSKAGEVMAGWTQGLLQYQFDFAKGALLRGWYVVELLVIPVLAFYFLTDSRTLREGTLYFTPPRYRQFVDSVLGEVGALLHQYVQAQVVLCIIKAVLVGLVLYLAGVKMYLTLALMAGIFRMAPVVGPLVAAVPCVGVPMLQNGLHTGLVVLAFYAAFIVLDGKLLTPVLLADRARLHPVIVILSLLLGYEFMGLLGLFVAVPIAGIIRAVYMHYQQAVAALGQVQSQPDATS